MSGHVKTDLFPSDFNQLFATIEAPIDYSIDETNEVVLGAQRALESLGDELLEITTIVGQGMGPDETPRFGTNYGLMFISFFSETCAEETRQRRPGWRCGAACGPPNRESAAAAGF